MTYDPRSPVESTQDEGRSDTAINAVQVKTTIRAETPGVHLTHTHTLWLIMSTYVTFTKKE